MARRNRGSVTLLSRLNGKLRTIAKPMAAEADMSAAAMQRTEPTDWPVSRPCLAALKDLGLSDGQVARYFGVPQNEVAILRVSFGIAEHAQPARRGTQRRRPIAPRRRG